MTLHIIKSDSESDVKSMTELCAPADCIVILQNGCYMQKHIKSSIKGNVKVFVIEQHCISRGIEPLFQGIDITQLADISAEHQNSITW